MIKVALLLWLVSSASIANTNFTLLNEGLRPYDGDTIMTSYRPVEGLKPVSIRINGIDTPEIRGRCAEEIEMAKKAKASVVFEVKKGPVTFYPLKWDKYGGRIIADVYSNDGTNVAQMLLQSGLARPYDGGAKRSWCK